MPDQYVLHITKWYPNEDDDLEGIFIQRHIQSTQAHFNSVVLYARATSKSDMGALFEIKELGSETNYAYTAYYKKKITGVAILDKAIKSFLYFYIMQKLYNSAIKKFGHPVILHSHVLLRSALLAWWYSVKLKIPYVITEHSTYFSNSIVIPNLSIKNSIRKFIVKRANAMVTVSQDLEKGMKKFLLYNKNYFRIFNCVNTNLYKYNPKANSEVINLLHISEFKNEHKNILGLLAVIKKLKENRFQFKFHLVGYGQDLDAILLFLEENNLNDFVFYHGKLIDQQLSNLYNLANAFILFSNKENMPCVIAESLCCGTPVISTNVGGISEVIHKNNGILIEKANQKELYDAISGVIRNTIKFDSNKISSEAMQLFSFESIGLGLNQVYRHCIGKAIIRLK